MCFNALTPQTFDRTGMSALKKSISRQARQIERRCHQGIGRRAADVDITRLNTQIKSIKTENAKLTKKSEKLQVEVEQWCSEAARHEELRNHWNKRFFLRDEEAHKLNDLLSFKDARIAELEQEVAAKISRIKKLEKALYEAQKSEKGPVKSGKANSAKKTEMKRKRGRQPGDPGHGRNNHDHLPIDEDNLHDISDAQKVCSDCGDLLGELGTEDSEEVEIEVRAYRRKHRRKKYGHFCKSKNGWVTETAPAAAKIWPKAGYGISVWVFVLIAKFVLHMPLHRVRKQLAMKGIRISEGTVIAGFKRIDKLLDPLIDEIQRYSREEKKHWHIDDTGWKVFVVIKEKTGFGWYLWVFLSDDVCVYIVSPSRGRKVPQSHLEHSVGVVTSDRLAANMKLGELLKSSFCWVHERREFRELIISHSEISDICQSFLTLIGSLFHYNKDRNLSEPDSPQQLHATEKLKETLEQIKNDCQSHVADPNVHCEVRRICKGILKDWDGLSLFFEMPEIPLHNNPAEQAVRGPAVARKSYYGSHSQWSAHFTAKMFTLAETLRLNNIDPDRFLTEYFRQCALNGGNAPPNAKDLLPWNIRSALTTDKPAPPE